MLRRVLTSALAAAALAGAASLAWLPVDPTPRAEARAEVEPRTSQSKLIASEAAFFVTFRPADFLGDELLKAGFSGMDKDMERGFHVPLSEIERVSLAVVPGGSVTLIHTHKAYDKDKLRAALVGDRYRFEEKDRKDGPRKQEVLEKKAGGKTIHYTGRWERWTRGFCAVDATTFAYGDGFALMRFFEGKGKASPEMTEAVALGAKHSLVLALDGKRLAAAVRHDREEREREDREREKRFEKKFEEEQVSLRDDKDEKPKKDKAKDDKAAEIDADDLFGEMGAFSILVLPYRPFIKAKFNLLTFDAKKTYTLTARSTAQSKDDVEELEAAMKMGKNIMRDFARLLPKMGQEGRRGFDNTGMEHLAPISAPAAKAFEAAKVERKGEVVSVTVTMTPDAGLAKKVNEAREKAEKKREEEEKKRRKEREERFKDEKKERFEDK
jgi:hypothetical protein